MTVLNNKLHLGYFPLWARTLSIVVKILTVLSQYTSIIPGNVLLLNVFLVNDIKSQLKFQSDMKMFKIPCSGILLHSKTKQLICNNA